ncbi:MAG: hypothetical protein RLO51_08000 [Thalassobaculum sp.]|uniref:transglutaminase domain-containing protein n=1 Tax=Thalassobaculum sp. TaxID=2022740 RepID=UPI0032EFA86F
MTAGPQDWYVRHGPLTDPEPFGAMLDSLPNGVGGLVEVVQGLLIHDAGLHLYDLAAADFAAASRETRPVSERLSALAAAPLTTARAPAGRIFATCRDYALLLTAFLRHKGVAARVRCGFADYLRPGFHADHWVCEYRHDDGGRWAFADAQMDAAHRRHLGIAFDPARLPAGRFLTAGEAWRLVRSGAADPAAFGHGTACGEWFLRVNLARDLLALGKREVSDWDGWRDAGPAHRRLDDEARRRCDAIAATAAGADRGPGVIPADLAGRLDPFWR